MLKFANINLMISGSGSGWILLNSPKRGGTRGSVQFLCCENSLLAEISGNSCFKLVFVFNDCVLMSGGPGAESFALVWQGDPIGLDVKWRPCSLSFSPPMIPTPAPFFFISVTLLPCLLVACYETSTRVSKWSYQHLILTPNTWLSLTKEGVPTCPTTVFRRPLYLTTIVSKFLTGAIFKCHPYGYPSFDAKK